MESNASSPPDERPEWQRLVVNQPQDRISEEVGRKLATRRTAIRLTVERAIVKPGKGAERVIVYLFKQATSF